MKTILIAFVILLCFLQSKAQDAILTFGIMYKPKKTLEPFLLVYETFSFSAAQKANVKSGDEIILIDNDSLVGKTDTDIANMFILAKEKGRVSITIKGNATPIILIPTLIKKYYFSKKPDATINIVQLIDVFNVAVYEGEYKDGMYNGKGTYTFGGKYKQYPNTKIKIQVGDFINGKFVEGITTYCNGDKFEGKMNNGIQFGIGTYTIGGTKFYGNYNLNGKWEGIIKVITADGKERLEEYENGVFIQKK